MKNCKIILSGPAPPLYDYGGPLRSLYSFYKEFSQDFFILWISINKFHNGQNLTSNYHEEITYTKFEFLKIIVNSKNGDTIWLNSFFELKTFLIPLFLKKNKIIVSPRGQLSNKAMMTSNFFLKKIFIKVFKILQHRVTFHSTCKDETAQIKSKFRSNVFEVPNLFKIEYDSSSCQEKKIVFYSRISKKKGILDFLKIFSKIKTNLTLDIFGYIEDKVYWSECEILINNDPRINYKGVLPSGNFKNLKNKYSFFLLPTYNENFGHTIVESLSLGFIPLITEKTTPFDQQLKYYFKLGFELNFISIEKLFKKIDNMNNSELLNLKIQTKIMFSEIVRKNKKNIIKYKNIFK